MQKTKTQDLEERLLSRLIVGFSLIALLLVGAWGYFMYDSVKSAQTFNDSVVERYQTDRVEMALAKDFVIAQLSASSTITHESRNENIFYFQGDEEDKGSFMFVIEQVSPAQFEIINGVSEINFSQEQ